MDGKSPSATTLGSVVEETIDFLLREMLSPEGGFYSTQDADSEGEEGKFYVWTPQEIRAAIGDSDAALFCDAYGVTDAGNFENSGASVLNRAASDEDLATRHGMSTDDVRASHTRSRLNPPGGSRGADTAVP